MSCLGIQNRRWRRTETLHCRAPCSPHLGTLLMTARGLAGRRRASCGIGSEARAPTRRSGPRIASDRVSRAHPTRSCNHRADTSCDKISQLPTHCPHLHSLRPPTHRRCRTHSRRPPRAPRSARSTPDPLRATWSNKGTPKTRHRCTLRTSCRRGRPVLHKHGNGGATWPPPCPLIGAPGPLFSSRAPRGEFSCRPPLWWPPPPSRGASPAGGKWSGQGLA